MPTESPASDELFSERLLLRRPLPEDAADALLLLGDPETQRFHPAPAVVDLDSALAWCARGAAWDASFATWHAEDQTTGRLVANVTVFDIDLNHRTAGIGYRVVPWARRLGVATEAVEAVAAWAFAERELCRLQLEHVIENTPSCAVARRAGFVLEGTLRSAYLDPLGIRRDCHVHGRVKAQPPPS